MDDELTTAPQDCASGTFAPNSKLPIISFSSGAKLGTRDIGIKLCELLKIDPDDPKFDRDMFGEILSTYKKDWQGDNQEIAQMTTKLERGCTRNHVHVSVELVAKALVVRLSRFIAEANGSLGPEFTQRSKVSWYHPVELTH